MTAGAWMGKPSMSDDCGGSLQESKPLANAVPTVQIGSSQACARAEAGGQQDRRKDHREQVTSPDMFSQCRSRPSAPLRYRSAHDLEGVGHGQVEIGVGVLPAGVPRRTGCDAWSFAPVMKAA
jgi:hypothetical protein